MPEASPPRVLITGGAQGIGKAIATRCREDGYTPVVLDYVGDDSIRCDLANAESTIRAIDKALADGPVTRVVNNVGAVFPNSVDDQTLSEFDSAVALNLRSAFLVTQALLPGMRAANFGRVVSVSSRAALGKPLRTAYSATKAGLLGMTKTWALEEARRGITVNAVAPGPVATHLFMNANPENSPQTRAILESVPVGRLGTPEDVAQSVSFLLDERTGFVTGQTLFTCGGMTVGAYHD